MHFKIEMNVNTVLNVPLITLIVQLRSEQRVTGVVVAVVERNVLSPVVHHLQYIIVVSGNECSVLCTL